MAEKRMLKRRHLIFYLRVIERDSNAILGFLVDITTQGFMMMSEFPTEVGKTFALKILLNSDEGQERFLEFSAQSKWCRQSINSNFFDTGFEVVDIRPEDLNGIREIIYAYGFND